MSDFFYENFFLHKITWFIPMLLLDHFLMYIKVNMTVEFVGKSNSNPTG